MDEWEKASFENLERCVSLEEDLLEVFVSLDSTLHTLATMKTLYQKFYLREAKIQEPDLVAEMLDALLEKAKYTRQRTEVIERRLASAREQVCESGSPLFHLFRSAIFCSQILMSL